MPKNFSAEADDSLSLSSPLFGRDHEVRQLREAYQRLLLTRQQQQQQELVLIQGAPGTGKTVLTVQ